MSGMTSEQAKIAFVHGRMLKAASPARRRCVTPKNALGIEKGHEAATP
jgi:hypothetical protein